MERTTSTILVSAWEAPDNKQGQRICVRQLWAQSPRSENLKVEPTFDGLFRLLTDCSQPNPRYSS